MKYKIKVVEQTFLRNKITRNKHFFRNAVNLLSHRQRIKFFYLRQLLSFLNILE